MTTLIEQVGTSQIFWNLDLKLAFDLLCMYSRRRRIENIIQNSVRPVRLYGYAFVLSNPVSVLRGHLTRIVVEKIA